MSVLTEMTELLEKRDRWAHKPSDTNDMYLLKSIVNYLLPKMPEKDIEAKWNKMKPAQRMKLLQKIGADKMKYGRDMASLSKRDFGSMGPKYTNLLRKL